ncbi:hypothetical protein [Chloracidobacterium aggregatum]|uniref:hypothetical protein n=1 Tax=Chloracidobacterium aggregatum TaxID=2851959 RepID=UPI001B8C9137|nr:hypothetical protein [Chloracidobacterium aggregatum]QUV96264.1 hypothetical protein J8C00_08020 [Chloracidobacterium sp. E]
MSKESFSDAGPDAPGALSGGAVERSDGVAKQRFEAYLVECVERLFAEIGTRLSNSLQQTLGRLVNVQSRSIDVLEKLEAEQRYMRAQIERLSADIALLRRGSMTPRCHVGVARGHIATGGFSSRRVHVCQRTERTRSSLHQSHLNRPASQTRDNDYVVGAVR